MSFALWLNQRIAEQRGEHLAPPGGSQTFRELEANGAELTVVARGDAFDCYQGKKAIFSFMVSPRVMLALARWVLWDWWIKGTWCGLKPRLWDWSLRRILAKS